MKTVKKTLKKVRARNGTNIYYTYSHWTTKEIDGVTFIPVVIHHPNNHQTGAIHWMKKDTMETVK